MQSTILTLLRQLPSPALNQLCTDLKLSQFDLQSTAKKISESSAQIIYSVVRIFESQKLSFEATMKIRQFIGSKIVNIVRDFGQNKGDAENAFILIAPKVVGTQKDYGEPLELGEITASASGIHVNMTNMEQGGKKQAVIQQEDKQFAPEAQKQHIEATSSEIPILVEQQLVEKIEMKEMEAHQQIQHEFVSDNSKFGNQPNCVIANDIPEFVQPSTKMQQPPPDNDEQLSGSSNFINDAETAFQQQQAAALHLQQKQKLVPIISQQPEDNQVPQIIQPQTNQEELNNNQNKATKEAEVRTVQPVRQLQILSPNPKSPSDLKQSDLTVAQPNISLLPTAQPNQQNSSPDASKLQKLVVYLNQKLNKLQTSTSAAAPPTQSHEALLLHFNNRLNKISAEKQQLEKELEELYKLSTKLAQEKIQLTQELKPIQSSILLQSQQFNEKTQQLQQQLQLVNGEKQTLEEKLQAAIQLLNELSANQAKQKQQYDEELAQSKREADQIKAEKLLLQTTVQTSTAEIQKVQEKDRLIQTLRTQNQKITSQNMQQVQDLITANESLAKQLESERTRANEATKQIMQEKQRYQDRENLLTQWNGGFGDDNGQIE